MSENETETPTEAISDDQLPPDLVPGDDNPLAEALPDGEDAGDLLHDGKHADEDDPDADTQTDTDPKTE